MPTAAESAMLAKLAYKGRMSTAEWESVAPAGWTFVNQSDAYSTGYFGVAFRNTQTNEVVISSRGTQSVQDLTPEAGIALHNVPDAFNDALKFAKQITTTADGSAYYAVGHSLGGAEAQYIAANLGISGTTFAAPGVQWAVGNLTANVTNYVFLGDPIGDALGFLGSHVGSVTVLIPNGPNQLLDAF